MGGSYESVFVLSGRGGNEAISEGHYFDEREKRVGEWIVWVSPWKERSVSGNGLMAAEGRCGLVGSPAPHSSGR